MSANITLGKFRSFGKGVLTAASCRNANTDNHSDSEEVVGQHHSTPTSLNDHTSHHSTPASLNHHTSHHPTSTSLKTDTPSDDPSRPPHPSHSLAHSADFGDGYALHTIHHVSQQHSESHPNNPDAKAYDTDAPTSLTPEVTSSSSPHSTTVSSHSPKLPYSPTAHMGQGASRNSSPDHLRGQLTQKDHQSRLHTPTSSPQPTMYSASPSAPPYPLSTDHANGFPHPAAVNRQSDPPFPFPGEMASASLAEYHKQYIRSHDSDRFVRGEPYFVVDRSWIDTLREWTDGKTAYIPSRIKNKWLEEAMNAKRHPQYVPAIQLDYRCVNMFIWRFWVSQFSADICLKRSRADLCAPQMPVLEIDMPPLRTHPDEIVRLCKDDLRRIMVENNIWRPPTGLINLGNTCFMNAGLQCFAAIPNFVSGLRLRPGCTNRMLRAMKEVLSYLMEYPPRSSTPLEPRKLVDELTRVSDMFANSNQQDCHEFMRYALDRFHEEMRDKNPSPRRTIKQIIQEHRNELSGAQLTKDEDDKVVATAHWDHYMQNNDSHVAQYFAGQTRSRVCCMKCQKTSDAFEAFWDLCIPVLPTANIKPAPNAYQRFLPKRRDDDSPKGDSMTSPSSVKISSCLDLFFRQEDLQGFDCEHCKRKTDATRSIEITHPPRVLLLQLKRVFTTGSKARMKVEFPIELKQSEYFDRRYRLIGAIEHRGGLVGTHTPQFTLKLFV
eukprot:GHVN01089014.1.p1 GENE.GHVN01089014.1~~GHVN01089014.1.p1  ORF type:complete len:718 (-),score=128.98 GHVN01089014.1:4-2157(-)